MNAFATKTIRTAIATLGTLAALAGCASVGPDYARPNDDAPLQYKAAELGAWKEGHPLDHLPKGEWWTVFRDTDLDALQRQALEANQELKAAFAAVEQARFVAGYARSEIFPSLSSGSGYTRERFSLNQDPSLGGAVRENFRAPLDLSYEIDLWGRIRRSVEGARADAAASAAAFHNLSLVLQADLAQNYFALRALDSETQVLTLGRDLRIEQLEIVTSRFDSGLGSELDVARAQTELAVAEGELAEVVQRRSELENAIAILAGQPPSGFRIAPRAVATVDWEANIPDIPAGLPSQLLERRPDVAEAERRLAAENARIGVAKAAFFPDIPLTASGGYQSASTGNVFSWDSRAWFIGPIVSLPIFSGGRNEANLEFAKASYRAAIARYRQSVLVAFGDVENAVQSIHYLGEQAEAQRRALESAQLTRALALEGYEVGITGFLDVIEADRAALQSERAVAQLAGQLQIASVLLIKSLGGGWQRDGDGEEFVAIEASGAVGRLASRQKTARAHKSVSL